MKASERKAMIRRGFDTVADNYDHPSLRFFPQTATALLDRLGLRRGQTLLDVCTGTGAVALAAGERLPEGRVTGIDLSSEMLAQGRRKAAPLGLSHVDFRQMDLDHLEFEQGTFDTATCSFGLFFVENMARALGNVAATVKPGGKIAISSFSEPSFEPYSELFLERVRDFGGQTVPLSWKRLSSETQIRDVFAAAGIQRVEITKVSQGFPLTSEHQWWDVVWNAGFRALLNQFDANELTAFKERHLDEIRECLARGESGLVVDVLLAVGIKD